MPLNNLPIPLTSFIGREKEIAKVIRLSARTRLLTLTGAGGCGKTRLALEIAARLADSFEHSVAWTELAPLNDPTLVPQTVASVFDLRDVTNQSIVQSLANYLRPQRLLLILDNCEHLITACARIAEELLQACPHLFILATSREALNVTGETAWRVPSLEIPDTKTRITPETLLSTESARLFVDRASSTESTFAVNQQNTNSIAQICYRLDGMPLALELAAARIKALPVEQIAARLDDRFRLLNLGSRTAPPRQQTLRAVIDWSYGSLSPAEKILFRRLAVFAGGWTLEAAETICSGEGLASSEILDTLARLVDKSLVIAQNDVARYHMLETIRQYAQEKLLESGEGERLQDRHLEFFYKFIEEADSNLRGAGEIVWSERLEEEHDNLRTAFEWSLLKDDPDPCLKFAERVRWFFWVRGYLREGRDMAVRAMKKSQRASKSARAQALLTSGFFMMAFGEYEQADLNLRESFALYEAMDDQVGVGSARHYLAMSAGWQGDRERQRALLKENLTWWRKLGKKWWIAQTLLILASNALSQYDPDKAVTLLDEALTVWKEIGNKRGLGRSLKTLADAIEELGNKRRALQLNIEALSTLLEIRDKWSYAQCLLTTASVTARLNHFEPAARFLGAAEVLRESIGYRLPGEEHSIHERIIAIIRSALDDSQFQAAWNEGRAMTMQQATEYALAIAPTMTSAQVSLPRKAVKEKFGGLTKREYEVAAMIAQGKSNREIAELLVLSERTVEGHVGNVLNKLGFNTRTQIAAWAVQKGLAQGKEK